MIIIVVGMLYIGWIISTEVGGVATVVNHAQAAGKFESGLPCKRATCSPSSPPG